MSIFIAILFCLTILYLACLIWLSWGMGRLKPGSVAKKLTVSIVVAARNEERNIQKCMAALRRQNYPRNKLEIIIVDDRSEDTTADLVSQQIVQDERFKLIRIIEQNASMAPKKWALNMGIQQARGEIIMLTDADCFPGKDWVQGMLAYFDEDVGLVAGFSPLEQRQSDSGFQRLMALDSLSLACVAAGSIGAGAPLTCNGRNLAYRKEVYKQVGGFSRIGHFISGDDDLFLHQVRDRTWWEVRYSIDPKTSVPTSPPSDFAAFLNQRTRHASKGKHYSLPLIAALSLIYGFNCCLLIGFPLSLFISYKLSFVILACFICKAAAEFSLLSKGAKFFNRIDMLKIFPLGAALHIPYVVIFGALGSLGKFKWKGQAFQAKLS